MKKLLSFALCLFLMAILSPMEVSAFEFSAGKTFSFPESREIVFEEENVLSPVNTAEVFSEEIAPCKPEDFEIFVPEVLSSSGAITYSYSETTGKLFITVDTTKTEAFAEFSDVLMFEISFNFSEETESFYYCWTGDYEKVLDFYSDVTTGDYMWVSPEHHYFIPVSPEEAVFRDGSGAYIFDEYYGEDYICTGIIKANGTQEVRILPVTVEYVGPTAIELPAGSFAENPYPSAERIIPDTSNSLLNAYKDGKLDYEEELGVLRYTYTGEKTDIEEIAEEINSIGFINTTLKAPEGYTFAFGDADYITDSGDVILAADFSPYEYEFRTCWEDANYEVFEDQIIIKTVPDFNAMDYNGYTPIPDSRLIIDVDTETLEKYGIHYGHEKDSAYFTLDFDDDADIDSVEKAGIDPYSIYNLEIIPPKGAVSYGISNRSTSESYDLAYDFDRDFYPGYRNEINGMSSVRYDGFTGLESLSLPESAVWYTETIFNVYTIDWYDAEGNTILKEYIHSYFEPFAGKAEKTSWLEKAGFLPIDKDRVEIPFIDTFIENGVNIDIGEDGELLSVTYDDEVDGKEIFKTANYFEDFSDIYMEIRIKKPEGAVYCTTNQGGMSYDNNEEDYFYGYPGYTGEGWEDYIDEEGYLTFGMEVLKSESNGEKWAMYKSIGHYSISWYDADGNLILKEFLGHKTDSFNEPEEYSKISLKSDYIDGGFCGSNFHGERNAAWGIDSEGVLYFYGSGWIDDYGTISYYDEVNDEWYDEWTAPWADYSEFVTKVVVGEDITRIGGACFIGFDKSVKIYFDGNAPTIGYGEIIHVLYRKAEATGWETDENGLWNGYKVRIIGAPEPEVIYGDIDGNEKVNVLDANLVRRYAARLTSLEDNQLVAADVDGNGKVNVLDANLVRRYAAKLISIFPVEEQ
ncbi:MAG: dockerin type I repeat-containing protein [Oscillospiraceae bacterium]|nr:dockerin type I repeat-containing protein [Oscillospiraceae bacterium]